jgi:hypothetical protein
VLAASTFSDWDSHLSGMDVFQELGIAEAPIKDRLKASF